MLKIKFINALGSEIEFYKSSVYRINGWLDSTNNVEIYDSKAMLQNGTTYLNNTLDKKDINIDAYIKESNKNSLIKARDNLNDVFNPALGEGYLIYLDDAKERKIKCIVNKLPYFAPFNCNTAKVSISLTACNPYWEDAQETKVEVATWTGGFHFPLSIPTTGIMMGYRNPGVIVNVKNNSSVETGVIIEFTAIGTVKNPSLINVQTQELFKINKTIVKGEIIKVDTSLGNKKVLSILNNKETNILNLLDLDSTFFQLKKGDNLFKYDAESGIAELDVNIYFSSKYLGV